VQHVGDLFFRYVLVALSGLIVIACQQDRSSGPIELTSDNAPTLVTLSPHLAELVAAIGADQQLIGVSAYTDYPVSLMDLPRVGDAFSLDQERLTVLAPEIILAWDSGTPPQVIDELRARNFAVEVLTTTQLADIPAAMRRIGELAGQPERAREAAASFDRQLEDIRNEMAGRDAIDVFYQVAARPLYTINRDHYISELINICGGNNVFADLTGLAPLIAVEAVVERDPEVMLASTDAGDTAFSIWQRWDNLRASRYDNFFQLPADEIGRATPRLLEAAVSMCDALEQGRKNRRMQQ